MALIALTTDMAGGVNYTHTTDTNLDWILVAPNTYFYDLAERIVYYKDAAGTIIGAYEFGVAVGTVTGLNTDNTDPLNPVVQISVDGVTITGAGTPASPLVSVGGGVGGGIYVGSGALSGPTVVSQNTDTLSFNQTGDANVIFTGTGVQTITQIPAVSILNLKSGSVTKVGAIISSVGAGTGGNIGATISAGNPDSTNIGMFVDTSTTTLGTNTGIHIHSRNGSASYGIVVEGGNFNGFNTTTPTELLHTVLGNVKFEGLTDPNLFRVDNALDVIGIGIAPSSSIYKLRILQTIDSGTGIYSVSSGVGSFSTSIRGDASGAANWNIGVYGTGSGATSKNIGVRGIGYATTTSNAYGLYSEAKQNTTLNNYGIYIDSENGGGGLAYSVFAQTGTALFNAAFGDYDFIVHGDNQANLLYVDASADSVGVGTSTPDASAILEISSTTKGLLLPRLPAANALTLTAINGLVIYVETASGVFITPGFWGYELGAWVKL